MTMTDLCYCKRWNAFPNKQGMIKLRANKPQLSARSCSAAQHQPPLHTHTHTPEFLNFLMSRCCLDTQHKSSNLLDIACEIEQKTDAWYSKTTWQTFSLAAFPTGVRCRSEACPRKLLTFCLSLVFGRWFSDLNRAFATPCWIECVWEARRRFAFDKLGPANRQRFRGMWETRWETDRVTHTYTPIHSLLGHGEECYPYCYLGWFGLLKVILAQFRSSS